MNVIYEKILEIEKNGQKAVLCTVVKSRGSTPRNSGSKMLVFELIAALRHFNIHQKRRHYIKLLAA